MTPTTKGKKPRQGARDTARLERLAVYIHKAVELASSSIIVRDGGVREAKNKDEAPSALTDDVVTRKCGGLQKVITYELILMGLQGGVETQSTLRALAEKADWSPCCDSITQTAGVSY